MPTLTTSHTFACHAKTSRSHKYSRSYLLFCLILFICPAVAAPVDAQSTPEPPSLMLANSYRQQVALEDYWVSEKYDGVRAYWDGKQLLSRNGNRFMAPAWFTAEFPVVPLDGELWMGRGTFARLSGAVRRQQPDEQEWRAIRYMVFDLPASDSPFTERLQQLQKLLSSSPSPYLELVHQFKVGSPAELEAVLQRVVEEGGEGLMLHRGGSYYRGQRSDDLLKVKTFEDAEAVVVQHLPGQGKYAGMLGALLVEAPDGKRFRLGTGFSDAERAAPPPIGSVVTYKFYGKTSNGLPRFASFLRVRPPE